MASHNIVSRCSPTYFRSTMDKILRIVGERQLKRIRETPLASWMNMPKLCGSSARVEYILKRFQVHSVSFVFGDDVVVPFTSYDFSIVLGLNNIGQPVDLDLRMDSDIVGRHFGGLVSSVNRKAIAEKLSQLADKDRDVDVEDFVKMFILFLFNCIIFPVSNYRTPRFILPYVDDLDNFFEYSWGDAAYRFLYEEMVAHVENVGGMKTYLDGSSVGLMAWFYERLPCLGTPRALRAFPRLFRWGESKIPKNNEAAEMVLTKITKSKIVDIRPFPEERYLVEEIACRVGVTPRIEEGNLKFQVKRLEKLVTEQLAEIEELKRKCVSSHFDGRDEAEVKTSHENEQNDEAEAGEEKNETYCGFDAKEEKNIAAYDEAGDEGDEEDACAVGTSSGDIGKGFVIQYPSSIAQNVMERKDRVTKRKDEMFMTPPSTRPKRKKTPLMNLCWTTDVPEKIDEEELSKTIENIAQNSLEINLEEYRGRDNFCGHNEVSDLERNIIKAFLCGDKLAVTVWEVPGLRVNGTEICALLFGKAIRSDLIDCYLKILGGYGKAGFEIFCMPTVVQVVRLLTTRGHYTIDLVVGVGNIVRFYGEKVQRWQEKRRCNLY